MRVLFSGSRTFDDDQVIIEILNTLLRKVDHPKQITVVHGGATGLDSLVSVLAHHKGMLNEVHYADWNAHGKSAGPIRNQKMVDLGADLLLAYPSKDGRGTQDCIARAVKAGIPTLVFDPVEHTYKRQ